MNYRVTKLLAATDIGPSGTKSIDINLDQPISRIMLFWKVTKSVSIMHSYCHKDISKIELVDGSDVLFAMDGGQAQALNIFDRKVHTMNHGQYIGANSQRSFYGIDFGRFLFDPVLALDPKKFRNLQLKVTYSEIISDTGGTDGTLEVIAEVFDEKVISPMGFLMSKVHHTYDVGASDSYEYIDLPTDYPFRKILLQGYSKGYEPWQVLKEARLNEDNEKRIPFDWNLEEYHQYRKGIDLPVVDDFVSQIAGAAQIYYLTPTDYWAKLILQGSAEDQSAGVALATRGGKFTCHSAGSIEFTGLAKGWLPNHCYHIPFGAEQDIADWYDVTKVAHLQIRLRAGSDTGTDGTGAVILQQLRKY